MKIDFSPDKSLFNLPIVKWYSIILLGVTLLTALLIALQLRHREFDFTGDGFNNFAALYKVPIGLLAVGFTIVGLCAANHRSEQAREQMRLTAGQNVFANHYKHIEEFGKYCDTRHGFIEAAAELNKKFYRKHKLPYEDSVHLWPHADPERYRDIYRKIFSKSKSGDFSISHIYLTSMDEFAALVTDTFKIFSEPDASKWGQAVIDLYDVVIRYSMINHINLHVCDTEKFEFNGAKREIPLGDAALILVNAIDAIRVQVDILSFDVSYIPSAKVNSFITSDTVNLPAIQPKDFASLPIAEWK